MGAGGFHGRVREGIGCGPPAKNHQVVRSIVRVFVGFHVCRTFHICLFFAFAGISVGGRDGCLYPAIGHVAAARRGSSGEGGFG